MTGVQTCALPISTSTCVISKEKRISLSYDDDKEIETYSIVATEITAVYEVEQVIKQLQSLIGQMSGNFVYSKGAVITDLYRIDATKKTDE